MHFIAPAHAEGGRLVCGGTGPGEQGHGRGLFIEPTVFADITPEMRLAREEVFGPVLGVLRWTDEAAMLEAVNGVEYGLTCSIWTHDLDRAHRVAMAVETGYVWINETSRHILGAPFGGVKQSGIGREECLEELLSFTNEKNIYIALQSGRS
jgi:betaine-aldehyde dehydrogenase